jgi:pyruvate/2-oxoglutarate dehydrogenase complex dihydrolipoamide dehydrogenase (E3) component
MAEDVETTEVLVLGGGPAGVAAALRAAELGAKTTLVCRDEFGGMAANDGPIPVRTLAHAARLIRDAGQLTRYGISVGKPELNFGQLLERVQEVVADCRAHSTLRPQLESLKVKILENVGAGRFVDSQTIATDNGVRIHAEKIILCTGGVNRRLSVPGAEFSNTHSDAWSLKAIPQSMLVIGGGATGAQVASIFAAFGSKIQLFHRGWRVLPTEEPEVSAAVADVFRERGMEVREDFGEIERFEKTASGVRMYFSKDGRAESVEASLAVVAVGWTADLKSLNLEAAGVRASSRGFIEVDAFQRTSAEHIFAAGDVTGRLLLTPPAMQDGFAAATNALRGQALSTMDQVHPIGSFTDPEYAQVGLTEAVARKSHDVVTATVRFDSTTRTIIDGRTFGFCKMIADRATWRILGCHIVGERAVELAQVAAVAITAKMRVDAFAHIPLSFPTYAGALGRAAANLAHQLQFEKSVPSLEG